jgi:hypothetical protein
LKWLDYIQAGVFSIFMAEDHRDARDKGLVIFVVDDEPMLLNLAEMVLKPAGFEVRQFQTLAQPCNYRLCNGRDEWAGSNT